jgi:hypothetical protein
MKTTIRGFEYKTVLTELLFFCAEMGAPVPKSAILHCHLVLPPLFAGFIKINIHLVHFISSYFL